MASQFPIPFAGPRQLRHLDPLGDFTQEFSRLFGNFFPGAGGLLGLPARTADAVALPRLDVQENEEGIRVCAELPGVQAGDVEVRVEGELLVISGEKKADQRTRSHNYHVAERSFGHFKRAIALPFTPDPQTVSASFDLGVLTVQVPRQLQRETSRRIDDGQRMPAGPDSAPRVGDEPAH